VRFTPRGRFLQRKKKNLNVRAAGPSVGYRFSLENLQWVATALALLRGGSPRCSVRVAALFGPAGGVPEPEWRCSACVPCWWDRRQPQTNCARLARVAPGLGDRSVTPAALFVADQPRFPEGSLRDKALVPQWRTDGPPGSTHRAIPPAASSRFCLSWRWAFFPSTCPSALAVRLFAPKVLPESRPLSGRSWTCRGAVAVTLALLANRFRP